MTPASKGRLTAKDRELLWSCVDYTQCSGEGTAAVSVTGLDSIEKAEARLTRLKEKLR